MQDLKQTIRYARAETGQSIAWSSMGNGPPLLACRACGHLEQELHTIGLREWCAKLSQTHTYIRYDGRGSGLSDRGYVDVSVESAVSDLESVADAAGLDRFPIITFIHGAQAAILYCARHPERVSRLVICGGYARGWLTRDPTPEQFARWETLLSTIRTGWDDPNPAFRYLNAFNLLGSATMQEVAGFAQFSLAAASGKNTVRLLENMGKLDVSEEARRVRCPVFVQHSVEDARVPFDEGRRLAALFPDARFSPSESRNSILMPSEPAFDDTLRQILAFLAESEKHCPALEAFAKITRREMDVLELIARGLDNVQIAAHLDLSGKTVRNHITAIFDKLGVENRPQTIVKARDAGLGRGSYPG